MLSNVYLSGSIKSSNVAGELVELARSWIDAPDLAIRSSGFAGGAYEQHERGYVITRTGSRDALDVTIDASASRPFVRSALILKNWGSGSLVDVAVNGRSLEETAEFRQGFEGEDLVVFLNIERSSSVEITLAVRP